MTPSATFRLNSQLIRRRVIPGCRIKTGTSSVSPPSGLITSIKLGLMGDSNSDEYRADDARGGAYSAVTFGIVEMMVRVLSTGTVNVGAWGAYAEPRRTGYAQNWSRSNCTVGDDYNGGYDSIISTGQHTSLAAQVTAGTVDTVVLWAGTNDFAIWNGNYGAIYDGTVAGANLQAKIDSVLANYTTAIDAVRNAGCTRILVTDVYDYGPLVTGAFPNATYRQRVTDAINAVNSGLDTIVAARSGVALSDYSSWIANVYAEYPDQGSGSISVAGQTITASVGDEPHNLQLGDGHFGTVYCGIFANQMILDRLNAAFDTDLTRMTDSQIIAQAGL